MGSKTKNIGLVLTGTTGKDVANSFRVWRQQINGENCNSNMELIDSAFGEHTQRLDTLQGQIPKVDTGLTTNGAAADAGETGKRIDALDQKISQLGLSVIDGAVCITYEEG